MNLDELAIAARYMHDFAETRPKSGGGEIARRRWLKRHLIERACVEQGRAMPPRKRQRKFRGFRS